MLRQPPTSKKPSTSSLTEKCTKILVDCRDLEYISSAGLRVLLAAAKQFKKISGRNRPLGAQPKRKAGVRNLRIHHDIPDLHHPRRSHKKLLIRLSGSRRLGMSPLPAARDFGRIFLRPNSRRTNARFAVSESGGKKTPPSARILSKPQTP